jgi:hypothetical protein
MLSYYTLDFTICAGSSVVLVLRLSVCALTEAIALPSVSWSQYGILTVIALSCLCIYVYDNDTTYAGSSIILVLHIAQAEFTRTVGISTVSCLSYSGQS